MIVSDHEGKPHLLDNLRLSCQLNGVDGVGVRGVTWGVFSPAVLELEPPDVILASDCFYCSSGERANLSPSPTHLLVSVAIPSSSIAMATTLLTDFEDIISLAAYFMSRRSQCQLWAAYQERR